MDIKLVDRWDDRNDKYMVYELDDYGKCTVKVKEDGYYYVMDNEDGYEVYSDTDDGYRDLTEDEKDEVFQLVEEQLDAEKEVVI